MSTMEQNTGTDSGPAKRRGNAFPRSVLMSAAMVVCVALAGAIFARMQGERTWERANEEPVAMRMLHFKDGDAGRVIITDAQTGDEILVLESGEGAFIRATVRGLAHARLDAGKDASTPFHLSHFKDGHLVLSDPVNQSNIDLGAFGHTNAKAFARLLIQE